MRPTRDPLTFYRALAEKPYAFDFFQVLRRLECLYPGLPRIGAALKPADEPVRLGQGVELSFAPSPISAFHLAEADRAPRMAVRFMGLLGPNGPLPLHITEYVREREMHADDQTLARFLDIFHHRFLALFYRAWAQAQPVVNLDRPQRDRFAIYVGASFGTGTPRLCAQGSPMTMKRAANSETGSVTQFARLFFAGQLVRQVRNRDGLAALLNDYFRVPVRIEEFVGHWLQLPPRERTRLGQRGSELGNGVVLGARVWDRQHRIRLLLGPLTLSQYESFLPGGTAINQLVSWLRLYLCFELDWDVRLLLQGDQVPGASPGRYGRLGWTTWLGQRKRTGDAQQLLLDPERLARRVSC